jgi:hypothetical protein
LQTPKNHEKRRWDRADCAQRVRGASRFLILAFSMSGRACSEQRRLGEAGKFIQHVDPEEIDLVVLIRRVLRNGLLSAMTK